MALVVNNNILFLHIPKTGGMWFKQALLNCGLIVEQLGHQHSHFPQLLDINSYSYYDTKFKIAIIRHPLTWYQSRWAFRMKLGWQPSQHPLDYYCMSNDFHVFMNNVYRVWPNGWLCQEYARFIDDTPGIVHIARLEFLVDDLVNLLNKSGVRYDENVFRSTPRVNDSDIDGKSSKYWATYTDELLDKVVTAERDLISKYYSDFNPNILCSPRPW